MPAKLKLQVAMLLIVALQLAALMCPAAAAGGLNNRRALIDAGVLGKTKGGLAGNLGLALYAVTT